MSHLFTRRLRTTDESVAFITWGSVDGRAREIAAALGGEAWVLRSLPSLGRPGTLIRYPVSAVRMLIMLIRRRPSGLIVTNPPIVPALIGWLYGSTTGRPVVLDSHPGSFGLQGDAASGWFVGLHQRLVPRVTGVLVTEQTLAGRVRQWGGHPCIVHEAPPLWDGESPSEAKPKNRPCVLFVGVFGSDEPVAEVLEAARRVPEYDFWITGDIKRCPPDLAALRPDNVKFLGYLRSPEYETALRFASVVLTLTTEPASVMRAAYEAVYAGRPLVVSDWPNLHDVFPDALFVQNRPDAIAAGLHDAVERLPQLEQAARGARERQLARWNEQLRELSGLVRPESGITRTARLQGGVET